MTCSHPRASTFQWTQVWVDIYPPFKLYQDWLKMTKLSSQRAIFSTKSVKRDPGTSTFWLTLVNDNIYPHCKFQWDWPKMTKLVSEKAIFSTKISQAWPMVTHAYRPFNGLKFGLISTHVSSFINIGQKMTKLVSEKAIFRLKSVRRDPWSPNHIGLLMDSSLGWYLLTF